MIRDECFNVDDVFHFSDFLKYIQSKFCNRIAFRTHESDITYSELCGMVIKCINYFNASRRKIYAIKIENNPIAYAIAFFSIVISDNIAWLVQEDEKIDSNCIDGYNIITDKDISDILKKNEREEIKGCIFKNISKDSVCTIVSSSGTTSYKKHVMLSEENLLSDTIGGMRRYNYSMDSIYVNVLPYSHLFGLVADLLGVLYSGGMVCCIQNKLNFFGELQFFKPTNLNLPPIMVDAIYRMLLSTNSFTKATGGNLKKIMCAGAKMDDAMNEEFEKYGMFVYSAYGLTECSPCVAMNGELAHKVGSVGKVLPCCSVKIVDDEICVKGSNVMLGYYNNDEINSQIIKDGWFYTGDLGYLDMEGFLFLTGRKNSLIVFEDGRKILPELVEEEINKIKGVKESIVSPWNERNKTKILVKIVMDDMIETKEINFLLEKLKIKSYVKDIYFSKEPLARNVLGKLIRNEVVNNK